MHLLADRDFAVDETTNTATRLRINLIFICRPVEIDTKTYMIKTIDILTPSEKIRNTVYLCCLWRCIVSFGFLYEISYCVW